MKDKLDILGRGMTSQRSRDRLMHLLREKGIQNEKVLKKMSQIPRHLFVDEAISDRSYKDMSLPIGFKQTISKPYTVAFMTQLLLDAPISVSRVLEIGTGSGYQSAVLASLIPYVYTVERIRSLHEQAKNRLSRLGYHNVTLVYADGTLGYQQAALYDGIIVTASAPCGYPFQKLLTQVKKGARLVIPILQANGKQLLCCYEKLGENKYSEIYKDEVCFVPLLSGEV